MSIIVPPSAKPNPAFGNKRTMTVGHYSVVFDTEFEVIHLVSNELDQDVVQFDNNVALDRYLDSQDPHFPVRYHTVHLPFHSGGIDDYLHEMGITIENRVEEPWNVEFSGSKFALMCMINDHYHSFQSERENFEQSVALILGTTPDYN